MLLWSLSLLLAPALAAASSAADYYVHSLPGAPEGPLLKMHAGLVYAIDGIICGGVK